MEEKVMFCVDLSMEKVVSDIFHKWHVTYDAAASSAYPSIRFYIDVEEDNAFAALLEIFNALRKEYKAMDKLDVWLEPIE